MQAVMKTRRSVARSGVAMLAVSLAGCGGSDSSSTSVTVSAPLRTTMPVQASPSPLRRAAQHLLALQR